MVIGSDFQMRSACSARMSAAWARKAAWVWTSSPAAVNASSGGRCRISRTRVSNALRCSSSSGSFIMHIV